MDMLQKEMNRNNKTRITGIIVAILLMIGYTIYTGYIRPEVRNLDIDQDGFTLQAGENKEFYYRIVYRDIASAEIIPTEGLSYGKKLAGEETQTLVYGSWENSRYGKYYLYIDPRLSVCCELQTREGEILLFSMESEDTTRSFLKAIMDARDANLTETENSIDGENG